MAQPSFVPITEADRVRATIAQPAPTHLAGRPAEMHGPAGLRGTGFGSPGPDQGYALKLAHGLASTIVLAPHEELHDVEVGAALIATKRASLFGRAPSVYDLQVALGLFGYLAQAPQDLVKYRGSLFQAISHRWVAQRELVDSVPEATLRLTPTEVAASVSSWRTTLTAG